MNTSTDTPVDPLVKDFITLCHDNAVGGAVNSDDEEDTMEISEAASGKAVSDEPDTPPTCGAVGNSSCVCGECDYKHYVALVDKQPEVTGHFFTTHPCNLPLGNIAFKPEAKTTKTANQANSFFKVVYESLTDYRINFVLEWPDFEVQTFSNTLTGKDSYVCKLHLKAMMQEGEDSLYQRHEAKSLHHTLQRLEEKYFDFLTETFQDFTIEPTHFQSKNGCMYLPLDTTRRVEGVTIDKVIAQYNELHDSGLLMQIRVAFAWMYPKEEDPTHTVFRAGIKYYLASPRKPLSPTLKSGNASISDSDSGTFATPTILIPRKRGLSRGEKMVQASLLPVTPKKPKKKARTTTVNNDTTSSKFQDTLLEEGCGTQVITIPHPYVFPAYAPGHRYNPHMSCKHVGPSRSLISLLSLPLPTHSGMLLR
jgi:hypothetical protein